MRKIFKLLFAGLFISVLVAQCKTKTTFKKTGKDTTHTQSLKILSATKFDKVNEQLNNKSELMTADLIALHIMDTRLSTQLDGACYSDRTVHLNDSIYYFVISANEQAGLCTYFFVASLNKRSKKVIASKLLHEDCDVDYSADTYETHEHSIVAKDKIEVTNTTVFQKKNRTSPDEEQNIDHKQIQKNVYCYFADRTDKL